MHVRCGLMHFYVCTGSARGVDGQRYVNKGATFMLFLSVYHDTRPRTSTVFKGNITFMMISIHSTFAAKKGECFLG